MPFPKETIPKSTINAEKVEINNKSIFDIVERAILKAVATVAQHKIATPA
jgi:hypothetical protein